MSDLLEAGGQFVPLTLAPEAEFGHALLYASYLVVPGSWAVAPSVQLSVPVRGADTWAADCLVVVSGSLSSTVGITCGPSISATFSEPVAVTDLRWDLGLVTGCQQGTRSPQFDADLCWWC